MKTKLLLMLMLGIMLVGNVRADIISLDQGWNFFAISDSNYSSNGYFNITVNRNQNLIGISSQNNYSYTDLNYSYTNGTILNQNQMIDTNLMNKYYQQWIINPDGTKGYISVPIDDSLLRQNKAYWVYINTTNLNITLNTNGGTYQNYSININNLTFSNGTTMYNITSAVSNEWIGQANGTTGLIQYWDSNPRFGSGGYALVPSNGNLLSWTGYIMWVRKPNIKMIISTENQTYFENGTTTTTGGNGTARAEHLFGYNNPNLPSISDLNSEFGYNNPRLPNINETEIFVYDNYNLPIFRQIEIFIMSTVLTLKI